jgi:hypothetical protein
MTAGASRILIARMAQPSPAHQHAGAGSANAREGSAMTSERWRQRDPVDGDVDWRGVRADGGVVAGLVQLGRSTVVYTYDARLAALDGARFANAEVARTAIAAALAAPEAAPYSSTRQTRTAGPARADATPRNGAAQSTAGRCFYDG